MSKYTIVAKIIKVGSFFNQILSGQKTICSSLAWQQQS